MRRNVNIIKKIEWQERKQISVLQLQFGKGNLSHELWRKFENGSSDVAIAKTVIEISKMASEVTVDEEMKKITTRDGRR